MNSSTILPRLFRGIAPEKRRKNRHSEQLELPFRFDRASGYIAFLAHRRGEPEGLPF